MGFFKKLKERLFKSSSKIDEGLDAIIEDGGEAEEVELEEDLKAQKETVDYATNEQADIEPVLNEPQLEQNAPTTSESIKTEEKKETDDLDKGERVEIETEPINPQIEQNALNNLKPTEPEEKKRNFCRKNSRPKKS